VFVESAKIGLLNSDCNGSNVMANVFSDRSIRMALIDLAKARVSRTRPKKTATRCQARVRLENIRARRVLQSWILFAINSIVTRDFFPLIRAFVPAKFWSQQSLVLSALGHMNDSDWYYMMSYTSAALHHESSDMTVRRPSLQFNSRNQTVTRDTVQNIVLRALCQ
jgi:hypothetical protein